MKKLLVVLILGGLVACNSNENGLYTMDELKAAKQGDTLYLTGGDNLHVNAHVVYNNDTQKNILAVVRIDGVSSIEETLQRIHENRLNSRLAFMTYRNFLK